MNFAPFSACSLSALCLAASISFPSNASAEEAAPASPSLHQRLNSWRESDANRTAFSLNRQPVIYSHQPQSPLSERRLSEFVSSAASLGAASQSAFPFGWNWRGDRNMGTQFDTGDNARIAESWRLGVDMPVAHPWGVAAISANYGRSRGGVADDAARAGDGEKGGGDVSVRQDLKIGALSGNARIALSQKDARDGASAERSSENGSGEQSADLRWQVASGLVVSTSLRNRVDRDSNPIGDGSDDAFSRQAIGQKSREFGLDWKWSDALSLRAKSAQSSVDTLAQPGDESVSRNVRDQSQQEVAVDWKWSKSLLISAQAARTRAGFATGTDDLTPQSLRDEQRAALSLQRRTGAGTWGLNWSRRQSDQELGGVEDRRSDALSLSAERQLAPWLSLRGAWRLAGEGDYRSRRFDDSAQREAEAQLKLNKLGNIAVRFSDWARQTASGDVISGSGTREYGIGYRVGNDNLGLAFDYSVRGEQSEEKDSNWRVGVTVR